MQDHRKLRVYPASLDLCVFVDGIVSVLCAVRKLGLAWQMERASMSVTLNIGEGAGRHTPADFARFLDMAIGSANEVECCVDIAVRLHLVTKELAAPLYSQVEKVRGMLCSLSNRVRGKRRASVRQATGNG
jgi:four helix bundle protein